MMKNKFILCGLIGWCLEIFWTGLKSFQRRQMKLEGRSSIWMFPIYGMAAFLAPIARLLRKKCFWVRGAVYTCAIFLTEYLTGSFLKKRDMCPWDYSRARFNIHGIIRLDYAPVWFLTGLLYERILYGRALTQQTAPESLPKNLFERQISFLLKNLDTKLLNFSPAFSDILVLECKRYL